MKKYNLLKNRILNTVSVTAAAIMLLTGVGANVYAAADASIKLVQEETYDSAQTNAYTYKAYRILEATYPSNETTTYADDDTNHVPNGLLDSTAEMAAYFIGTDSPWLAALQAEGQTWLKLTAAADGSGYAVSWKDPSNASEAEAIRLANYLKAALNAEADAKAAGTIDSTPLADTAISLSPGTAVSVEKGYYLIDSEVGSNLALVTTDVNITEKNEYPVLSKEFTDAIGAAESTSASDSVQIGDTVSYTLTVKIPSGANQQIVLTDTFTSGLTPVLAAEGEGVQNAGTVAITTSGMADQTTAAASAPANGSFTVTISKGDVIANAGKTISVVYQAVVTKDAALTTKQENKAKLNYGSKYETSVKKVDSDTYKLTINKTDGLDPLEGAVFQLHRGNKDGDAIQLTAISDADLTAAGIEKADKTVYYRVADAGETGSADIDMRAASTAVIFGLDGDSAYAAVETKAPAGYNLLEQEEVVAARDADRTMTVVNAKGSILPDTGGIGTTVFYMTGGILILGAGVVLAARRRAVDE